MSIRFKFRSSLNFETVEFDNNRSSISVGELRARILRGKNQQQGFDLVFSDADTGLEYKGDDCQIPSGSSVIAKRVPAGTVPVPLSVVALAPLPVEAVKDMGLRGSGALNPANGPKEEVDDVGTDLCHMLDSELPQFDIEVDASTFNQKEDVTGLRLDCQKLDSSGVSHEIPGGSNQTGKEVNSLQEDGVVDHMKLNKLSVSNFLAVQSDLPLEFKCSLCNTFFKEAVMIPCCQHSFCDKCIRLVLTEKGRCPKCFSSKCHVKDLLPNLSLRQAIEHFLESQMFDTDLNNAMQKYVPDGESGIQANDVSCAVTNVRREPELPQSSFATGKGSSQSFVESSYDQHHQRKILYGTSGVRDIKSSLSTEKIQQRNGARGGYPHPDNKQIVSEDFAPSTDFQGESQPFVVPQANVHDEANSSNKRKGGFWPGSGGGERNFFAHGGHKKGGRNCYTCGSPDHLMRDCPVSNADPMFQPGNGAFYGGMPGYAPPYWDSSSFPHFRPYANMYTNSAATMTPFNASFPVSPFFVPPYTHSMSSGMPGTGEFMRMGNMGPPRQTDYIGLNRCENSRKHSNEHLGRERFPDNEDDYRHNYPANRHDNTLHKHKDSSLSHSEDSLVRSPEEKNQHDKYLDSDICHVDERHEKNSRSFSGSNRRHTVERSNSGMEETPKSSDRHREERHRHHHGESKIYHERRGHYDSDSSMGNHSIQKDVKKRVESDGRGSHKKHHSHSESTFEPKSHVDRRIGHKESHIGHDSRHSRHNAKHSRDRQYDDRWKKVGSSGEDSRDEYYHNKRKRVH